MCLSDFEHVICLATTPGGLGRTGHIKFFLLLGNVGQNRTEPFVLNDRRLIDPRPFIKSPIGQIDAVMPDCQPAIGRQAEILLQSLIAFRPRPLRKITRNRLRGVGDGCESFLGICAREAKNLCNAGLFHAWGNIDKDQRGETFAPLSRSDSPSASSEAMPPSEAPIAIGLIPERRVSSTATTFASVA